MTKYVILEKAKPYIRYRRGKLERVSGYPDRPKFSGLQHLREFSQIGPQLGSQPGGLFKEKATGTKWYIKRPPTEEHAHNEKLTADLYQLAGIQVPKIKLIEVPIMKEKEWGFDKGIGVASEWIEGLEQNLSKLQKKPAGLAEGFAVDAWLANWDVVGASWDNLLLDSTGHAIRVDTGGGLRFRARGKPKTLNDSVGEWDSMRKHHPEVWGNLTNEELVASGQRVVAIPDAEIQRVVAENGFGKDLADLLIARKREIGRKITPKVEKAIYYIDLEKAKPYVRYRRGKLEHVKGYHGKDRKLIEIKIDPGWGKQAEELQVRVDEWKKLRDNKEELAKMGFEYVGKDKAVEKYTVAWAGMKEEREAITECDVLKHRNGSKIYINADDIPSQIKYDLTQWDAVFDTAKRWSPPDVFYRGGTVYGPSFSWTAPDGSTQSGMEAGVCQYDMNRLIINDDMSGWWVDAHEMGHMVMSRIAHSQEKHKKEDDRFVNSLGNLKFTESLEAYNKSVEVLKGMGISFDDVKKAEQMVFSEILKKDSPITNELAGAVYTIRERLRAGQPVKLSEEEQANLKRYEKINNSWKSVQSKFGEDGEWMRITKEEPLKSHDPKVDNYINAEKWRFQENFAEFYQLFTINLFNLPKHDAIQPAWEGLQELKNTNPKKFQFFVDSVFPKEYKAFRKVALAHMRYVEGKIATHD